MKERSGRLVWFSAYVLRSPAVCDQEGMRPASDYPWVLGLLQCFDTVGWMAERHSACKKPVLHISKPKGGGKT